MAPAVPAGCSDGNPVQPVTLAGIRAAVSQAQ